MLFEGDRAVGVAIKDTDGTRREIRAKVVVDASGQAALLQNRIQAARLGSRPEQGRDLDLLGRRVPRHRHGTKARRWSSRPPTEKGWFWYIPLHDNIVSVGVVAPFDYLFKGRDGNHEQTYQEEVDDAPPSRSASRTPRASTGYFATRDYSYRSTQVAGDGWVLVGDAFGFLDPLYSSGVLLALKSGELAADAIVEGLHDGRYSARRSWALGRRASTRASIACAAWCASTTTASASAKFVKNYPHLRNTVTDLLIGDLFTDRVDKVWEPMESLYKPGKAPIPPWHEGAPGAVLEDKAPHLELPTGPTR